MPKYEFAVTEAVQDDDDTCADLDEMGLDGWVAVGILPIDEAHRAPRILMQREVVEETINERVRREHIEGRPETCHPYWLRNESCGVCAAPVPEGWGDSR